jgi:VCBS repeat-containing protein
MLIHKYSRCKKFYCFSGT